MYSTEIPPNTATIRNVNVTEIDSDSTAREHRIKRYYSDKLKTTKQTLTTSTMVWGLGWGGADDNEMLILFSSGFILMWCVFFGEQVLVKRSTLSAR